MKAQEKTAEQIINDLYWLRFGQTHCTFIESYGINSAGHFNLIIEAMKEYAQSRTEQLQKERDELQFQFNSLDAEVEQLQKENAQLKQENERLKAQNIDLAFKVANVKSNVAHYFGDACQHEYVRVESTVPYMQCRKCFHRYDAENVLNQPSEERKPTKP